MSEAPPPKTAQFRARPAGRSGRTIFPLALDLRAGEPIPGAVERVLRASIGVGEVVVLAASEDPFDPGFAAAARAAARTGARLCVLGPPEAQTEGAGVPGQEVGDAIPSGPRPRPVHSIGPAGSGSTVATPGQGDPTAIDWSTIPVATGFLPSGGSDPADLAVVSGSLLQADSLRRAALASPGDWAGLIVSDPWAGGRLNGQALRRRSSASDVPIPNETRALAEWIRPALAFGFLALPRRRTLGQAALQFLLGLSPVAAVAIPMAPAEALAEALRLPEVPPLDEREIERIFLTASPPTWAGTG